MAANPNEVVIPGGKIYFDKFDANGVVTGERYLGDTSGAVVKIASTELEHRNTETGASVVDYKVVTKIDRTGEITIDTISTENVALFFLADTATVTQTSGSVTAEAITVKSGLYYQLGVSGGNPTGVRGVSAVVVKNNAGTTTYVVGTDYTVDLTLGRIYIVPGGAIATAAAGATTGIKVDYTKAANTRTQIATGSATEISGALRVVADNAAGEDRDFYAPSVTLAPSGDYTLKDDGSKFMTMKFALTILTPTSGSAVYIDGRAA